jgi:hypothetical protein
MNKKRTGWRMVADEKPPNEELVICVVRGSGITLAYRTAAYQGIQWREHGGIELWSDDEIEKWAAIPE